jgi:hypothetical protein
MQPTAREMQAMAAAGQISLDDLRAVASAGGVHDEFLDQMLGVLPQSASWPDLSGATGGGKAPEGAGQQAEGMQQQFGGSYDNESALLASRLRQHQISGAEAAAAKQMAMQQLADLRQQGLQVMMLQQAGAMGRSTAAGGGGGMLLPLSLGSSGSGGDVQALLKAGANSAVQIHRPLLSLKSTCCLLSLVTCVRVFIRCSFVPGRRSRRRVRRQLRRIVAAAAATFPAPYAGS